MVFEINVMETRLVLRQLVRALSKVLIQDFHFQPSTRAHDHKLPPKILEPSLPSSLDIFFGPFSDRNIVYCHLRNKML